MATNLKFRGYHEGTKAEFIANAKATADAQDLIVFITGGESESSCIYAKGMYFADFTSLIAALAFVKGVRVGDSNYDAAAGGGYVKFEAADPATVVYVENDGVKIGLDSAFVTKVNDTATNLATVMGDYLKAEDRTALEKLIADTKSEIIGTATDASTAETLYGVKKYVDEQIAEVTTSEEFTGLVDRVDGIEDRVEIVEGKVATIEADYLKAADKAELAEDIKVNTDAIAVLNGNSETAGSVDKKVADAINDFATKISDDDTINTFKELIDYAATHGSEFTELVGEVDANTKAIETLNGDSTVAGSVDKKIADAIASEVDRANQLYATQTELSEGVAEAKTHAETKASEAQAAAEATAQEYANTAKAEAIADADGKLALKANSADVYLKTDTYSKAEVDAMFEWVVL